MINNYLHYNRIRRRGWLSGGVAILNSSSFSSCDTNFLCAGFRFGPPFLMREDRSISWDQLQQSILSKLYYLMINGAQAQVIQR